MRQAKENIDKAIKLLREAAATIPEVDPDIEAAIEVIQACEVIDNKYLEFCLQMDSQWGDEPGTAYKKGICMEFQIEADWWHEVSLALRKIKERSKPHVSGEADKPD